jgi:hypothetical protein
LRSLLFVNTAAAQPTSSLTNEQIHRIGDYGKLWSVLKLFNPEMAYNTINADSLFTNNIDNLLHDPSASNFKSAVEAMLAGLHDPYTSIMKETNNIDSIDLPNRPLLKWLDDSIAVVCFNTDFVMQNFSNRAALLHFMDTLQRARGVIIDLRQAAPVKNDEEQYYESEFMKALIGVLADGPVMYPSMRTRIHYGHESETFNSSFYYQGWLSANALRLTVAKACTNPFAL